MSLFTLPNEILEQILWQVSSDDIENFSATCRLLRALARPCLKEHFKLKSQYGFNINYPSKQSIHPAAILSAIVERPKVAYYIKALSVTFRSTSPKQVETLIAKHDGFLDQLNEVPWIPDREVGMWHQRISSGNVDALFALLLCYLHNLRELRIQRPLLIPMTSVIVGRLRASIVESISCDTSSFADFFLSPQEPITEDSFPTPPGLSRLERVIIDPAASAADAHPRHRLGDFARFVSFSSLPALQHLNGISLVSRKYNLDQAFTGFSGLRSIRLVNCNVAVEAFRSLFSGITALESFHYTPTTTIKDFRLAPIVEELKRYTSHSLGRLYLRHTRIEDRPEPWRYRAFEQLKKIDLDWRCVVHYESAARPSSPSSSFVIAATSTNYPSTANPVSTPIAQANASSASGTPSINALPALTGAPPPKLHHPPLVDTLPRSTESIKLVDTEGEANLETVRWIFFRLVMQRAARLPNLKIVIFVTPRRDCWLHAKDICARAGLKFPSYGVEKERKIRGLNFVYE